MNANVEPSKALVVKQVRVVESPIPVLDTAQFEHMQRVAQVMAACTLMPDSLCTETVINEDGRIGKQLLPMAQIVANCFLVVNQAVRWGMDPFAVAQCVSVVNGKLCHEGKLVQAVLDAKLGIELQNEVTGDDDKASIVIWGVLNGKDMMKSDGKTRKEVKGTVAKWRTDRKGSPWRSGAYESMLRYRGNREWARAYAPALMLGVYSEDEMEVLSEDYRAQRARNVTPAKPAIENGRDEPPDPADVPQGKERVGEVVWEDDKAEVADKKAAAADKKEEAQPKEADDGPPDPDAVAGGAPMTPLEAVLAEIGAAADDEKLFTISSSDEFQALPKAEKAAALKVLLHRKAVIAEAGK